MTTWKYVLRSLTHYWRLNLAVLAGVFLTAAILSGALVVGDSVKESLRRNAELRIGKIGYALLGGDRFFTTEMASRIGAAIGAKEAVAPLLQVQGTVTNEDGSVRVNGVQIVGVPEGFWEFAPESGPGLEGSDWLAINEALAKRLGVREGDSILGRVEVPGDLSKDAPLSGETDQTVTVRQEIAKVITPEQMGRYSLRAEQVPASTIFLPLEKMQNLIEKPGKANLLLLTDGPDEATIRKAVDASWTLADASLGLKKIRDESIWELSSERVFIDPSLAKAAREIEEPNDGVLTYLVNGLKAHDQLTPYSMVTSAGPDTNDIIPEDLGDDQIVVIQWLADDLGLKPGDEVSLEYFVVAAGRQLTEETSTFKVHSIIPMDTSGLSEEWTPEFPGVSETDSCRDWRPGFAMDYDRIRDKDDDYWKEYKGTPKAFISAEAGRKIWANRFGDITGVHYLGDAFTRESFEQELKQQIAPEDFGLQLRNVKADAAAAVSQSFDFGALFASMSFFLMIAALILTALIFIFGIEQRASQIGCLMALGLPSKKVRRMFLLEAVILSALGALSGLVGGFVYTRLALLGMSGAWSEAAAGVEFVYSLKPASLAYAWFGTVLMALVVVWFASRAVTRVRPSYLISGGEPMAGAGKSKPLLKTVSFWILVVALSGGVGTLVMPKQPGSMAEQGAFFGSGFLFTLAGVFACVLILRMMERPSHGLPTLTGLGRQNAVRRKGRSVAVVALMASGVFMVTAINSFRLDGQRGTDRRDSGTGGFTFVGESTLPIYENLNLESAREDYGLASLKGADFKTVQFRVNNGEDASCLNLNRAQQPRLMGVKPGELASRGAFKFSKTLDGIPFEGSPWEMLNADLESEDGIAVLPAVIDMNTAAYALAKGLGDSLDYETGSGATIRVKIVGMLENSLLQGSLIIAEDRFIQAYPDAGGYRYFLIDVEPRNKAETVSTRMTRMLEDRGLELKPAWVRLDEFNAVQNTYLSIFTTLGGLGILLGTVGLAVVVGRNVMERRGQLALMQAVGLTRKGLGRMVLAEHWFLHVSGVVIGIVAALIAVSVKVLGSSSGLPWGLLIFIDGAILAGGLLFCWLAARTVLRTPLMEALRSE